VIVGMDMLGFASAFNMRKQRLRLPGFPQFHLIGYPDARARVGLAMPQAAPAADMAYRCEDLGDVFDRLCPLHAPSESFESHEDPLFCASLRDVPEPGDEQIDAFYQQCSAHRLAAVCPKDTELTGCGEWIVDLSSLPRRHVVV